MIDLRTTRTAASMILVMLVAALWRTITWSDGSMPMAHSGVLLLLYVLPASSASLVACPYRNRRAADDTKTRPWHKWGRFLAISYCGGMLLMQGVVVLASLGLDLPVDLAAIARALAVVLAIASLLAINQMPKLPWLESRFSPGGELGPIYGSRYTRLVSRILVVFQTAVVACNVAAPQTAGWHSARYILLAAALLVAWSIAWRWHLGRKWRLEQLTMR
jgi:hypothetical protein